MTRKFGIFGCIRNSGSRSVFFFMKYRYRARTPQGEIQSGVVEAPSREVATEILQHQNLIVTGIEEVEKGTKGFQKEIKIFKGKIKSKDLVFFFRQLSILVSANVSLVEALNVLAKQIKNPLLAQEILEIAADVDGGMAFSEALARYPKTFSTFIINMVKTGEIAGNLQKVLEHLADHIERDYLLNSKIKGAMYYPIFVIVAIIFLIIILLVFVIPRLSGMFEEMGAELPLPTRVILNISNSLNTYGWILLILLLGIGVGLFYYLKTPKGRVAKDTIEIKLPVLGPLFQNIYFSKIAENLGTLIRGGIPIVQALDTVSIVIGNSLYKNVLENARDSVRRGETIAESFSRFEKIIPPTFTQMIASGEKSGNLQKVLMNLSRFYNNEVDTTVSNLMSLLEPVLMVFLGLGVGFVAAAVLLPIYNLAGTM